MSKPKQSDIAKVLGVTEARVTQLKAKGMPVDSIDVAADWYRVNIDQKLSPKLAPSPVPPPAKDSMHSVIAGMYDLQEARAKREHHEANIAAYKERQMVSELVVEARVTMAITKLTAASRSAFEKIPDKIADRLAVESDSQRCHALLTDEIYQVLADLSAGALLMKFDGDGDGRG